MEPVRVRRTPKAMNMKTSIQHGAELQQLEQLEAAGMAQQAKPTSRAAHQMQGHANIELKPKDAIDNQAGVREGLTPRKRVLAQRMAGIMRPRKQYVSSRRSRGGRTERTEELDEETAFLEPVRDVLDDLSDDARRESQEALDRKMSPFFEPIQRYRLYFEALQLLDQRDMEVRKKTAARRALNGMMTRLMNEHPEEMRRALQEIEEMSAIVSEMAEDLPTSVRDLRFIYGAKSKGKEDTPLSPLTMLKALIKNFGADKCVAAMISLCSRMMSGL